MPINLEMRRLRAGRGDIKIAYASSEGAQASLNDCSLAVARKSEVQASRAKIRGFSEASERLLAALPQPAEAIPKLLLRV